MEQFLTSISKILWGDPLLILFLGTHIFLTFRLKGVQKHVFKGIKFSLTREKGATGDVSPFSALMTALAATIGTGNIVGVATAVSTGGPGAIFWMWISGILGMSSKYAESFLSVKYRTKNKKGEMCGGPMYVMQNRLHMKWLGKLFAIFTAIAALGIGSMVQANSISTVFKTVFNVPLFLTGLIVSILVGFVILGGIKSIAKVCNFLIPFASVTFIACNFIILFLGRATILNSIVLIISSAFSPTAAVGGFLGTGAKEAMRLGVSRGLFSNEAGLGSEPIVAASAQTKSATRQALISMSGTFWDTVVLAAITGIMIVNSGLWITGESGAALTALVFDALPYGRILLAISLFAFAFATCIGWSFYAQKAVEYLFGEKYIRYYLYIYVFLIFIGAIFSLNTVWAFSDIANGLMAVPNIFVILILSKEVSDGLKKDHL